MIINQLMIEMYWIFGGLAGLSFAGAGAVFLLVPNIEFRLLAAPLAGLLLLILLTTSFYVAIRMPLGTAVIASYILLIIASATIYFGNRKSPISRVEVLQFLIVLFIAALFYSWVSNYAAILSSGPAIS